MKIQFGCGGNRLVGFENHDSEVNICERLPYADGVAEFVFIEHCLEHVNAPDAYRFMEEAYRILEPGGVLRICVPELTRLDRAHARDIILGHGHQMVYCFENIHRMLRTAGFSRVRVTQRQETDSHWKVIGEEKDDLETLRVEAVK